MLTCLHQTLLVHYFPLLVYVKEHRTGCCARLESIFFLYADTIRKILSRNKIANLYVMVIEFYVVGQKVSTASQIFCRCFSDMLWWSFDSYPWMIIVYTWNTIGLIMVKKLSQLSLFYFPLCQYLANAFNFCTTSKKRQVFMSYWF